MSRHLLFIALNFFVSASLACLAPSMEDYVLLDVLPEAANSQPIIAKVRLLKSQDRSATVEVTDAIVGTEKKAIIQIQVSNSSCSWLSARSRFSNSSPNKAPSDIYFIAGEFSLDKDKKQVFIGSWRDGKRIQ
jgi:hypothetical protein